MRGFHVVQGRAALSQSQPPREVQQVIGEFLVGAGCLTETSAPHPTLSPSGLRDRSDSRYLWREGPEVRVGRHLQELRRQRPALGGAGRTAAPARTCTGGRGPRWGDGAAPRRGPWGAGG